jgi:hypothetical protein
MTEPTDLAPSPARRLLAWIEPALLWGLGAWMLAVYFYVRKADVDAPSELKALCALAYLSEFFLLHSGAMIGSLWAKRRPGFWSAFRTWAGTGLLLTIYGAFIIPGGIAMGVGWLGALVFLVQILRSAMTLSRDGGRKIPERMLVGMFLLFAPVFTALLVGALVARWIGPMGNMRGDNNLLWMGGFFFAYAGFFASPLYAALRDRLVNGRRRAAA